MTESQYIANQIVADTIARNHPLPILSDEQRIFSKAEEIVTKVTPLARQILAAEQAAMQPHNQSAFVAAMTNCFKDHFVHMSKDDLVVICSALHAIMLSERV